MKERGTYSPLEVLEISLKYQERVIGFGLPAETKEGLPLSMWSNQLKKEYIQIADEAKQGGLAITVHAGAIKLSLKRDGRD
jgi:hypothetical protein